MLPVVADRASGYIKWIIDDKKYMDLIVGKHLEKDCYEKTQSYLRLAMVTNK